MYDFVKKILPWWMDLSKNILMTCAKYVLEFFFLTFAFTCFRNNILALVMAGVKDLMVCMEDTWMHFKLTLPNMILRQKKITLARCDSSDQLY